MTYLTMGASILMPLPEPSDTPLPYCVKDAVGSVSFRLRNISNQVSKYFTSYAAFFPFAKRARAFAFISLMSTVKALSSISDPKS